MSPEDLPRPLPDRPRRSLGFLGWRAGRARRAALLLLPLLLLVAVAVALVHFRAAPPRPHAPAALPGGEALPCPPLADVDRLPSEASLRGWREVQQAYGSVLRQEMESLRRGTSPRGLLQGSAADVIPELLQEADRLVRVRVLMERAHDRTLPVGERRQALASLRDEGPDQYAAYNWPTDGIPWVPPELQERVDAARLLHAPPASDVERLPPPDVLARWQKQQEALETVLTATRQNLSGEDFDPEAYQLVERRNNLSNDCAGRSYMRFMMQHARDAGDERNRRIWLDMLRCHHPEAYASRRWPEPIPPLPPDYEEFYRRARKEQSENPD